MTAHALASDRAVLSAALSGELRYSTVWEDHVLLERGLRVEAGDEILCVASAGCNVLNLLLHAPRRIVAIDFNPAQTALVELKLAAATALSHAEFLNLLGIDAGGERLALYERVRPGLSTGARNWWDARTGCIASGIEAAGRLERYIAAFRDEHLLRIHPASRIEALFAFTSLSAQRRYAIEQLFTPELVDAFRSYFTRESLAARGRSVEQLRYVENSEVGSWFLRRLRWACAAIPARGNFYLERFLLGHGLGPEHAPPYARREWFERLRALAPRVEVVCEGLESYLVRRTRAFTKAALSDVFEYLSEEESAGLFEQLAHAVRPGGRIAYWNLFVPRTCPAYLHGRVRPLDRLSHALWRRDRAWFYSAFHVEALCAA